MKVKELIEHLQKLNQEQDIWYNRVREDGEESWEEPTIMMNGTKTKDGEIKEEYTIESAEF